MNQKEAIEQMKIFAKDIDTETAHRNADKLLCEILIQLGWEKLVKEYDEVGKWYA